MSCFIIARALVGHQHRRGKWSLVRGSLVELFHHREGVGGTPTPAWKWRCYTYYTYIGSTSKITCTLALPFLPSICCLWSLRKVRRAVDILLSRGHLIHISCMYWLRTRGTMAGPGPCTSISAKVSSASAICVAAFMAFVSSACLKITLMMRL